MRTFGFFMKMVALCAAIAGPPAALYAQTPALLPVQGTLVDSEGKAVDGNHTLSFRLFDNDAADGAPLFAEDHEDVMVDKGRFAVYLGDGSGDALDLSLFRANAELWLQMTVDGTEELAPLFRLGTVPYAAYADSCRDADTVGGEAPEAFARASQSLGGLTCAEPGHVAQWDGSNWLCGKVAEGSSYTDGDAIAAMGAKANDNPLNHDRYADSDAVAAMGAKASDNPLNHDRYTDANAVSAVMSSPDVQTQVNTWAQSVCYDEEDELLEALNPHYAYTEGLGITIVSNQISAEFAGSGDDYGSANTVARSDHAHDYASKSFVSRTYKSTAVGQALRITFPSSGMYHGICTLVCQTLGYKHRLLFHFSFGTANTDPVGSVLSEQSGNPFGFCLHGGTDAIYIKALEDDYCDSEVCYYSTVCFGYNMSSMIVDSADWPSSGC